MKKIIVDCSLCGGRTTVKTIRQHFERLSETQGLDPLIAKTAAEFANSISDFAEKDSMLWGEALEIFSMDLLTAAKLEQAQRIEKLIK